MTYESSPYDIERSLLQKAVRRGNTQIVEKVVKYLKDDLPWLKKRIHLIAYEECWPEAHKVNSYGKPHQILTQYKNLATLIKNKNASGLADLAMNKTEWSAFKSLFNSDIQREIDIIIKAVDQPRAFWNWIKGLPEYKVHKQIIDSAEADLNKMTMPADKTMMFASAYLTTQHPFPEVRNTTPDNSEFPFWVALDKHTQKGREIYIDVAKKVSILPVNAMKLGFYLEGCSCNEISDSPFWDLAVEAQLKRVGLSRNEAFAQWERLKPIIIELAQPYIEKMIKRFEDSEGSINPELF